MPLLPLPPYSGRFLEPTCGGETALLPAFDKKEFFRNVGGWCEDGYALYGTPSGSNWFGTIAHKMHIETKYFKSSR